MRIAISQRSYSLSSYNETGDYIDRRWYSFLKQCNVLPFLIPNDLEAAKSLLKTINPQGILLTGGDDDKTRLTVEHHLIQYAIKNKLPLLGVCHGMQCIQRYFNVELHACKNHVMPKQAICLNGKTRWVNSYHQLGTKNTVPELLVLAKAADGIVKAIRHQHFPLMGIMWHPERIFPYAKEDIQLFKEFFCNQRLLRHR